MSSQIVLMTGSSSGIGLAIAKRLAHDPDHRFIVIATVIAMSEKADLEAAIGGALNKSVFIKELDVTNSEHITGVVDDVIKAHGRVDVLLNIAGIAFSGVPERVTRDEMERIFNVNVFGTIQLTQAVLPHMKHRKAGKIVTASSIAGRMGWPYFEFYSSTKFALEGFFEALASSLRAFNIRVCLVEPGGVNTGLIKPLFQEIDDGSTDDTVDDIDKRQLGCMKSLLTSMVYAEADAIAGAFVTRCLDVNEPGLRHLLDDVYVEGLKASAADLTGETAVEGMTKSSGFS